MMLASWSKTLGVERFLNCANSCLTCRSSFFRSGVLAAEDDVDDDDVEDERERRRRRATLTADTRGGVLGGV